MSEDSRALGLGLKASASPFVPKDPAPASAAAGSSDSSSSAVAAINGAASVDKPIISDGTSSAAAAAVAAAVAGVAAGKAPKPAPKLSAAAVTAAPFVPGTAGASSTSAAAAAAAAAATAAVAAVSATPAAAKAKQQGRGGKQQQQGRQQQQQQQKQLQQKEEQPKDEPAEAGEQRQQDERRDQKDAAKAPAGRMSAAAAAFVPKAPGSGAAAGTPPPAAPPGSISQQQARPQSAGSAAAAARLRSPLKGSNTPAAAAATPSPARNSGSRTGRQGGRNDGPGSARGGGPGGSMYGSGGGFGGRGPPGFGSGLPGLGLGGSGGGPKRALLAQSQGNYQYAGAGGLGYGGGFHHHHPGHQHQHHGGGGGGGGGKQLLSERFISEGLRQQLQQSNYLRQLQHTPVGDEPSLPDKIGVYHTLFPLEDVAAADAAGSSISAAWGVRTTVLKGISARDGRAYALRVVCGKQVIPSLEMLSVVRQAVEAWSCLAGHPGLLVPLEGLVSSELDGSPSLVVVAGYVPGAVTLAQAHLQPTQTVSGLVHNTPSEELLWSYTVQLAGILRATHSVGLALRSPALSATKVLLTPVGRLKVSGLGVAEALTGEVVPANSDDLLQLQRDDVAAMGQLLLQLACAVGSLPAPSLDFASAHYSSDFVRLLVLLLGVAEGGAFSWRAVSALLGERLLLEMDSLAVFNEQLLEELSCEMENGRLLRLISKLSFVTDRPADAAGGATGGWSDTGDRYLLQLFRDFVFHQGELDGGRVLDWGHVIECLNKLDAGVAEQVLLQSRDERSLLVVSYADIKRCIETAIAEIRSRPAAGGHGHLHHMPGGPGGVGGLMRPPHGVTMFGGMGR